MNPYLPSLLAISLLFTTSAAHAEEQPAPSAETQALRLELASVNAQHDTAVTIHIVSAVVGVAGVGSLLGALGTALTPSSSDVVWAPTILVIVGGSLSIVNFILTCIGAGLDFGSASHRRKLRAAREGRGGDTAREGRGGDTAREGRGGDTAQPELALELTPGPGDVGVGLSLSF